MTDPSYFYNFFWALFWGFTFTDIRSKYPFTHVYLANRAGSGDSVPVTAILISPTETIQYVIVVSNNVILERAEEHMFSYRDLVNKYDNPTVFFIAIDPKKKIGSCENLQDAEIIKFHTATCRKGENFASRHKQTHCIGGNLFGHSKLLSD